MSAVTKNGRGSRLRLAKIVRLSQLRNLRECEQVAAVCYRVRRGDIEFLLVRTRGNGARRWTFPKGSAEPGLTHAQAAALEAFEEAGVHGRIEEASFARYVRRGGRKPGEKVSAVTAHLCEVLRLGAPKESKRSRTWFSAEDAMQRLRERRTRDDGTEFTKVVVKAVERIQRIQNRARLLDSGLLDARPLPLWNASKADALQKAPFDFAEAYGSGHGASFLSVRRRLAETRQSAGPAAGAGRRALQGEVLEFSHPRGERAKALGSGARNQ